MTLKHAYTFTSALMLVFVISMQAQAVTVADIEIADTVTVDGRGLVLNGAGLRTKFFIKVYAGALYLTAKQKDPEAIFKDPAPKRIIMHFIYDEVEKGKLTGGWTDGFENNNDDETFARLKERLTTFNNMFETLHEGDRVVLDFHANGEVHVSIKGQAKGVITGQDFQQALLKVWLGEDPADWGLRDAMLGDE